MCDKKGKYSFSHNPCGGKLSMGKDAENVCVFVYSIQLILSPIICFTYVVCQLMCVS